MSRFLDFLDKLNAPAENTRSNDEPIAGQNGSTPDPQQILSVLELPRTTPFPKDTVSELRHVPLHRIDIEAEHRLVFHTDPDSLGADRFRLLRMRLRTISSTGKMSKVLITSPLPQDGKSTVALNLATALTERGNRPVLLIDADLHRLSLTERLGLKGHAGLRECVDSGVNPLSVIRSIAPLSLYFLAAGMPRENPTELLQSGPLSNILQKLSTYFEWILIDSPPVLVSTDAVSLAHETDATLLVARAGSTSYPALDSAVTLLGEKRIVGIVLNGAASVSRRYSQYRNYYRQKRPESEMPTCENAARPTSDQAGGAM